MLLYLLRHAIAQDRAESDAARELTPEGVAQARSVAQQLKERAPAMDRVISSPYLRAQQTASCMMSLFPEIELECDDRLRPSGDIFAVMNAVGDFTAQNVMLVGHNPFMSKMLSLLVEGTIEPHHYVGNACLHCLSLDVVASGCAKIMYTLDP